MKKTIALLMTLVMCLSLCACTTSADRKSERTRQSVIDASKTVDDFTYLYERAKSESNKLANDIAEYERAAEKVKNAK